MKNNHDLFRPSLPTILPLSNKQGNILSIAQERIWFLSQLMPDSPFYNISATIQLEGSVHISVLEQCFNEIIRRHTILRTTFKAGKRQPFQYIVSTYLITLPIIDLVDIPVAMQETHVQQLLSQAILSPFNLEQGPLLHTYILRLSKKKHILLITMHCIIADTRSLSIFEQELATLYQTYITSNKISLPEIPIQYTDFAYWQRQLEQSSLLESQMLYWLHHLTNVTEPLELPLDHPRPAIQTYQSNIYNFTLPMSLTDELQKLAGQYETSLFIILLAVFKILFYRYSGQKDILIGLPIANRNQETLENLIGFFANTLVLYTHMSNTLTFPELLEQIRELTTAAYANQDLPFEKLIEKLQLERDLSKNPLCQITFAFQDPPLTQRQVGDLVLHPLNLHNTITPIDLALILSQTENGLVGSITYSDLFEIKTIQKLIRHYCKLLESICITPNSRIGELPLLTDEERQQLLIGWNATEEDYQRTNCVNDLFEQQAKKTPDAVALVFEDQNVTYGRLDDLSNQIAHYLQTQKIGPEAHIGLCMKRSIEQIVGLLGILKAGAVYVPLDPEYPAERFAFILCDAQIDVLLTQESLLEHLPPLDCIMVCLDTVWKQIHQQPSTYPIVNMSIENIAYLIYTSGSTGKPKGIAMIHSSLVNLLTWQSQRNVLPESCRTLQFASLNFDVSFQEIFSTWHTGGTLFLLPEQLRRDPVTLLHIFSKQAIERLFLPFITLQNIAEVFSELKEVPLHLYEIIVAGEQLQINQYISHFVASLPNCTLHNHYGPSECHVVTSFILKGTPSTWPVLPSIGRPIANNCIYILDAAMQCVPIGIIGEIYIGGNCLARGYHKRADLTAENFLPDPFSQKNGARLYKTGDIARFNQDGNIEFLGRIDQQVKIRGFRVEPGEIEVIACQHPSVKQCMVVVHIGKNKDKQLIAYIVPSGKDAPLYSELRSFLLDRLPEYMVPSHFTFLEQFPLTPSGKVARNALPAIDDSRPTLSEAYIAPGTFVEQRLAEAWQELLGLQQVGIHDNFFDLGGHSLLLTRMRTTLEELSGKPFAIIDLFMYPTIASLATYVSRDSILKEDQKEILKRGYSRAEKRKNSQNHRAMIK